jgi:hypothetical protein
MANPDDEKVVYFGETDARNKRVRFGIKKKDRSRHLYAIGKTGMGKSTLLENLAVQDIQNGDGLCFLDPHGKSADLLLEYVPEHRIKDVIYFAPFDMDYPISFNVMEDVGPEQRYLVASGMMSAFKKIWVDAWSARMEYILGNIMLALLEYPGSTLVGVNRMLTDKDFRKEVVSHISDPSVKSFWVNEYANYTDKFAAEAAPAIQNKVGQFIANPLIRNIIGQPKSSFDIRDIMDNKKILIINLSKGRVGEANANLLGSMLITKIYLGAMSRADLNEKQLAEAPNFYLYVDEFQSFANESFADILSEARKYKLNLHIAHQYIEQMTEEVRAAVFGNVGTMCVFRVGAYDAEVLEKEFAPQFTAEDIVNLQKYQMYLKLMIDGVTSPPFSAAGMTPIPKPEKSFVKEIIDSSRALYAHPRLQVEEELVNWIQNQFGKNNNSGGGQNNNQNQQRSPQEKRQEKRRDQGNSSSQNSQGNGSPRTSTGIPSGNIGDQRGVQSINRNEAQNGPSQNFRLNSDQNSGQRNNNQNQRRSNDLSRTQQVKERTDQANARENKLREAMSLSYLKPEDAEDKKTPKPENLAALREALLNVMKPSTIQESSSSASNKESVEKKENTNEVIHVKQNHHKQSAPQQSHGSVHKAESSPVHVSAGAHTQPHQKKETARTDLNTDLEKNNSKASISKSTNEVAEDILKNIFADES